MLPSLNYGATAAGGFVWSAIQCATYQGRAARLVTAFSFVRSPEFARRGRQMDSQLRVTAHPEWQASLDDRAVRLHEPEEVGGESFWTPHGTVIACSRSARGTTWGSGSCRKARLDTASAAPMITMTMEFVRWVSKSSVATDPAGLLTTSSRGMDSGQNLPEEFNSVNLTYPGSK